MFGHLHLVVYLCVSECIFVSADMLPYCSAHDEWRILKLLQYVRYNTANNVSNVGGDPVTQLIVNVYQMIPQIHM